MKKNKLEKNTNIKQTSLTVDENQQAKLHAEQEYQKSVRQKLDSIPINEDEFEKIKKAFFERQAKIDAQLQYEKATQEKLDSIPVNEQELEKIKKAFEQNKQSQNIATAKNHRKWQIVTNSAVALVLVVVLVVVGVFWFGNQSRIFNENTPYVLVTFSEIAERTSKNPKLPIDFESELKLSWVRMYYPRENEPCAISIRFGNESQFLNVVIMLDSNYDYFEKSKYQDCYKSFEINGTVGLYTDISDVFFATFTLDECDYYLEGLNISFVVFQTFMESLK